MSDQRHPDVVITDDDDLAVPGPSSARNEDQVLEETDSGHSWGKLIVEEIENTDWQKSPFYLFGFFEKIGGYDYAKCKVCEADLKGSLNLKLDQEGNPAPHQLRGMLKITQSNTKGIATHLLSSHPEEYELFEVCRKETIRKREEKRAKDTGKKRCASLDSSQLKFAVGDGTMKLDMPKVDPDLQEKWDKAVVDFCAKTHTSFTKVSSEPWNELISLLFTPKKRVELKSRITISRHVEKRATELLVKITKVIRLQVPHLKCVAFTTDIWTSRGNDSYISLTVHFIDK